MCAFSLSPLPTCNRTSFRGWDAVELSNGLVRLVAVPDIGGRIMALDLGDHPFLFVDPDLAGKVFSAEENQGDGSLAAWKNYGGDKTWPAPQGWETEQQWHGPPDPVLDTGRYSVEHLASDASGARLRMASPPDPRTGIQIVREFRITLGSSRVQVHLTFRNVSQDTVRWGIWDVVQLDAGQSVAGKPTWDPTCVVTTPIHAQSCFERGFNVMFGSDDNPQWQTHEGLFRADYQWQIGKVGIDSPAGWIAFVRGSRGVAFVGQFTVFAGADYPDGGATVECWTVGAGKVANLDYAESGIYLMETEVLSPLHTIAPGAEAHFDLTWSVCRCDGHVIDATAAGCASARLQAQRTSDGVLLEGSFGVFDEGELLLRWGTSADVVLDSVSPLSVVRLHRVVRTPNDVATIELVVRGKQDGYERLLAAAEVSPRPTAP